MRWDGSYGQYDRNERNAEAEQMNPRPIPRGAAMSPVMTMELRSFQRYRPGQKRAQTLKLRSSKAIERARCSRCRVYSHQKNSPACDSTCSRWSVENIDSNGLAQGRRPSINSISPGRRGRVGRGKRQEDPGLRL